MESVLERMLAVEKEAALLVQQAERDVEQLTIQARHRLEEQQQQWQQQARDSAADLLNSEVTAAEAKKQATLQAAAPWIAERGAQLEAKKNTAVAAALTMLAALPLDPQ